MEKKQNTLNALNEILFDNLRKLDSGEIDDKKAFAVSQLSNTIISNAKTQLAAYKMTGNIATISSITDNVANDVPKLNAAKEAEKKRVDASLVTEGDYAAKTRFATERGFVNLAECIACMGKVNFLKEFKEHQESAQK